MIMIKQKEISRNGGCDGAMVQHRRVKGGGTLSLSLCFVSDPILPNVLIFGLSATDCRSMCRVDCTCTSVKNRLMFPLCDVILI